VEVCLAVILLGSLSFGCSPRGPASSEAVILRLGSQNAEEAKGVLTELLFAEPLLVLDWHGRPVARLAADEGWEWLDDGLTLRVRLRHGVTFHDGTALTARIVANILRQQMDPKKPDSASFRYVRAIETPDEHTVVLRLSRADGFLVEAIAGTLIVDETKPDIGTGPFRIVSRDPVIVTKKNDAYYRGVPGINQVQITTYDTPRTAWAAMMRGVVDVVQEVNRDSVEFLEGASRFDLHTSLRPFYMPLVFNLEHPILGRLEVRRALAIAIDRDEILREVLRGHGRVADDPIWPNHWAYNPTARKYTRDPAASRAALDAAGLPMRPASVRGAMDSRFRIGCVFWEKGSQYERTALLLQRQLAEVGVDLDLESADQQTLTRRVGRGEFDTYLFQLASGKAFDFTYRFWRSGPGQYQKNGYTGADAVLDRLRLARTDADVRVTVADLRQRFFEDVPAAFLVWPETTRAIDSRFDIGDRADPEFFANLWRWKPAEGRRASR
jgi:ABC-type transport system substrate-binding protein